MSSETVSNRARVAIIGVEGSGKTVLMSVVAHRFNGSSTGGVFFYPLDLKTMQYVDRTWNTLSLGQWPPSTPAGDWPDLQWQVSVSASDGNAAPICDLRFVDAAGQDLRRLFSDNLDDIASLPGHLQRVWDYCRTADIVVCLVNLKDFYGEGNLDQKSQNEQFITWALHQLSINHDPHRRVMLLFTQIDQYRKLLTEKGGLRGVAQEILPIAYRAHIATSQVSLHKVAAVNDVELAEDEAGNLRPVPKKDFGSKYLDEFVRSIVENVKTIVKAREVKKEVESPTKQQTAQRELQLMLPKYAWERALEYVCERALGKTWKGLPEEQKVGTIYSTLVLIIATIALLVGWTMCAPGQKTPSQPLFNTNYHFQPTFPHSS